MVIPDKNKNSTNLGIRQQITRGISKKMIIWGASRTVRKSVEFTLQGKYKLKRTIVLGLVFEDKGVENEFYLARLPDRIQSIKSGLNALFVMLTVLILSRFTLLLPDFQMFSPSNPDANVTLINELNLEFEGHKKDNLDPALGLFVVLSVLLALILRIISMKTELFIRIEKVGLVFTSNIGFLLALAINFVIAFGIKGVAPKLRVMLDEELVTNSFPGFNPANVPDEPHYATSLLLELFETTPCTTNQGLSSTECNALIRLTLLFIASTGLITGLAVAHIGLRIFFTALVEIGPRCQIVWSVFQLVTMTEVVIELASAGGKVSE